MTTTQNAVANVPVVKPYVNTSARGTRLLVAGSGNYAGFSVCYCPKGSSARRVYKGPLVPGPFCDTFACASVMDNHGGTGAELAREDAAGNLLNLQMGDLVRVGDEIYSIHPDNNNNIKLKLESVVSE